MNNNWISVKDKLPNEGFKVLVVQERISKANCIQIIEWWKGDESDYLYWQPLPKLPEAKK